MLSRKNGPPLEMLSRKCGRSRSQTNVNHHVGVCQAKVIEPPFILVD